MLRSLFNEPWLNLCSTVGIRRYDSHKRRGLKIVSSEIQALQGRKEFFFLLIAQVKYTHLSKNKSICNRNGYTNSTFVVCCEVSLLAAKYFWGRLGNAHVFHSWNCIWYAILLLICMHSQPRDWNRFEIPYLSIGTLTWRVVFVLFCF